MATYFKEITEQEIIDNSVKKLANRPSSPSKYSESRLTAEEVKEAFDKLPRLIAQRYNTLIYQIRQFGGDEILTTAYDGNRKSLNEIFRELESGLFANALKCAKGGESLSVFYEKMRSKVIVTSGEPTEYTVGQIGTILVAIPEVPDTQPVETVKLYVCTKVRDNRTYEWALVAGGGDGSGGIASIEQTKVSTEDGGENIITIYLKSGEAIPFSIFNGSKGSPGEKGEDGKDGTDGADGVGIKSVEQTTTSTESEGINAVTVSLTNDTKYTFFVRNGKQGGKGDKGEPGLGFSISKIYSSISAMNVGYSTDGVPIGGFVLINTNNVDDPDNAKLYVKGNSAYSYLTDLSGAQGIRGEKGKDAVTFTPSIVNDVLSWTNDGGLPNPPSIYLKGEGGSDGIGVKSVTQTTTSTADGGDNVVTVTLTNGNTYTFTVKNGSKGSAGKDGSNGRSIIRVTTALSSYTTTVGGFTPKYRISLSTVKSESGASEVRVGDIILRNYYTYLIGYVDNSYVYVGAYASIRGSAGTSVSITEISESTEDGGENVVTFSNEQTLTIKNGSKGSDGKDGTNGKDGKTPVKGTDYWTEADKAEIVQSVIETLGGEPIFGYVDDNNNIVLSGNLSDGTYTVKYEMDNGSTLNIGELKFSYKVTNNLTYCTNSNKAVSVANGGSYSATITANSGYTLKTVTVTMGGSAVSVSGGTINIAKVTGDIVITAVAEKYVPSYTNLANPSSSDWWADSYFSSAGAQRSGTGYVVTNFVGPVNVGDIIYIKGIDITGTIAEYRCAPYKSDKTLHGGFGVGTLTALAALGSKPITNLTVSTTGGQFTNNNSDVKYWRIGGKLNGTANDVVITINEPIV